MKSKNLKTSPIGFMLWDKDLCKFATIKDVKNFVSIENDIYGEDEEMRLQCFGRFTKLADTGMVDKNDDKIYEGFILQVICECMDEKYEFRGVVGFEKAGFVLFGANGDSAILSVLDPVELEIIGNIYQDPGLIKEELWQKQRKLLEKPKPSTTFFGRLARKLKHLC